MFETIILALLFVKIKKYKIKPLFKSWTIYPVLFLELVHIIFQINMFLGNYYFVQFAPVLKQTYMYMLLIPIFYYEQYFAGLLSSGFIIAGTVLNKFVMAMNGGKMPVFPKFSYITGYTSPEAFAAIKGIHIVGDANTHWWFLSDIIDIGWSILSIGDILIRCFCFITFYYTIKTLNSDNPKTIMDRAFMKKIFRKMHRKAL